MLFCFKIKVHSFQEIFSCCCCYVFKWNPNCDLRGVIFWVMKTVVNNLDAIFQFDCVTVCYQFVISMNGRAYFFFFFCEKKRRRIQLTILRCILICLFKWHIAKYNNILKWLLMLIRAYNSSKRIEIVSNIETQCMVMV